MPKVNKALAILAALAFFLPFATISCNGMKFAEMSGFTLAKCTASTCSPDDIISPEMKKLAGGYFPKTNIRTPGQQGKVDFAWPNMVQIKDEPDGANYVLYAAIACLVALGALFLGVRIGEILSGIVSVAAIVFLFLFRIKFGDAVATHLHTSEVNAAAALIKFDLEFSSGFWLSVIMSAASAVLAFRGTFGGQRAAPLRAHTGGSQTTSVCPACSAVNPGGSKFCLSCGGPLSPPPAPNSPATLSGTTCSSCGSANVAGNKFCLSCGKPLVAAPSNLSSPPVPQTETKAVAAATAAVAQAPSFMATTMIEPQATNTTVQAPAVPPPVAQSASTEPPRSQPVCKVCGTAVGPMQKFCLSCGTAVAATQAAAAPPPPTVTTTLSAATTRSSSQYQPGPFQTQPRNGNMMWLVVVALVVVLGIAGWFTWRYFAGPDVTVTTIPQRIHVAASGRTALQASVSGSKDGDVTWSIQEGNKGGQITPLGAVVEAGQSRASATYAAPQANGVFHVIATSHANPNRSAKIEIIVGGASQPDAVLTAIPAPPAANTANPNVTLILGAWRWPSGDMQMTVAADSTITVTSAADPQKNLHGTYRFTDNSRLQIDFGNGDVRTWQILGVDGNYLRVLSQSKNESSPTAMVFAKIAS